MRNAKSTPAGVYTSVDELLGLRAISKDIDLAGRKPSHAAMEGSVRTRYRGRGMEFAEVRPYQAGDDIRTIDWRVTARMQSPYTKLFQEERERPIFVMVDQRSPMFFGSRTVFKSVYAAQFAAMVAWSAQYNNDRIGALVFGDREQADIRARRGKYAVLELLNRLVTFNHQLTSPISGTNPIDLKTMITETRRIARPGSLVILLSDFHDSSPACAEPLAMLTKRSDVMAMHIYDPLEQQLPVHNRLAISDGTQRLSIDTDEVGPLYAKAFSRHQADVQDMCFKCGVQYLKSPVGHAADGSVSALFNSRKRGASPNSPRRGVSREL